MKSMLPTPAPVGADGAPAQPGRRSFLVYGGAGVALGSLWLAGCTAKEEVKPSSMAAPTISNFMPSSGPPGTTVTLIGTNLTTVVSVMLGGTSVGFKVVDEATISLTVPASATSGPFSVATAGGTASSSGVFTVLPPASTISSFTPGSGLPGTVVTLTGTNFTGTTSVTLGGVPAAFTVVSPTTITLTVPATAQTGLFVLTTPSGTGTSSTAFTVLPEFISVGAGDTGVLNYLYALEQVQAAFYAQVVAGAYFGGATLAQKLALDDILHHGLAHREYMRLILGTQALRALETTFATINFADRVAVLTTARTLKDLSVAAYNGVARYLGSLDLLLLLNKMASVEARHAALLRDLLAYNSFAGPDVVGATSGLELSKVPAVVAPVLNQYLAAGSRLDVSNLV